MIDDENFQETLWRVARASKDTGAKVGAIIVRNGTLVVGACNEPPIGVVESAERRTKPTKYLFTEHAERNAILLAARYGHRTQGCVMYQTWFPCADCARAIIQAGIVRLVCEEPDLRNERWGSSFTASLAMLTEAGTSLHYY
jgi:dCMP deaminase